MRMDDGFTLKLRRAIIGFVDQKFAEQKSLAFESLRFSILAEQVGHLIAKDGDAAWFDSDDGRASFNVGAQSGQRLFQRGFGLVEHAEVIERATAAERLLRNP